MASAASYDLDNREALGLASSRMALTTAWSACRSATSMVSSARWIAYGPPAGGLRAAALGQPP